MADRTPIVVSRQLAYYRRKKAENIFLKKEASRKRKIYITTNNVSNTEAQKRRKQGREGMKKLRAKQRISPVVEHTVDEDGAENGGPYGSTTSSVLTVKFNFPQRHKSQRKEQLKKQRRNVLIKKNTEIDSLLNKVEMSSKQLKSAHKKIKRLQRKVRENKDQPNTVLVTPIKQANTTLLKDGVASSSAPHVRKEWVALYSLTEEIKNESTLEENIKKEPA